MKRVRGMGMRGGGGMGAKRKQLHGQWAQTAHGLLGGAGGSSAPASVLASPTTPVSTGGAAASTSAQQSQQSPDGSIGPTATTSTPLQRCTPASTPTSEDGGASGGDFSGFGSASISGGVPSSPNTSIGEQSSGATATATTTSEQQQQQLSASGGSASGGILVPYSAEKAAAAQLQALQEELPYFPEKWPGKVCALCCLGERSHLGQGEMMRLELAGGAEEEDANGSGSAAGGNGSGANNVSTDEQRAAAALEEKSPRIVGVLGAGPQLSNRRQKGHNKCK